MGPEYPLLLLQSDTIIPSRQHKEMLLCLLELGRRGAWHKRMIYAAVVDSLLRKILNIRIVC